MTSCRKKPGMAFWAIVVMVGLVVVYPLSWGPVQVLLCLPCSADLPQCLCVTRVYEPLHWILDYLPDSVQHAYCSYLIWWLSFVDMPEL